ncbi:MAG: FHA domain-containing protein, partial [Caldilinea sp.]|nr:FHA domain-containing protein [Caldilinea sp.]
MSVESNQDAIQGTETEGSPKPKDSAMLVLQRGAEAGRRWPLDRTRSLMIGRDEDCDIHLPDRQVSRNHARIYWTG